MLGMLTPWSSSSKFMIAYEYGHVNLACSKGQGNRILNSENLEEVIWVPTRFEAGPRSTAACSHPTFVVHSLHSKE